MCADEPGGADEPGVPAYAWVVLGVVMLAGVSAPLIFGRLVQNTFWATAGYCMIRIALIGLAVTGSTRMR